MAVDTTELSRIELDNSALIDRTGLPVRIVAGSAGGGGAGDASAANQVTEIARLTSIKTAVESIDTKTPAAPATAANQATGNTSVGNIDTAIGAKADATWDGAAAASGISIWRYLGTKLEAIRALLAGTLSVNTGLAQGLTDTQLRASAVPISGALTDTQLRATAVPVSGPLTDVQIRATPLPVSGTVAVTGPLTDTQLRATAVPVSGPLTDTQLRATAVPVSGPLTDTQLRASAIAADISDRVGRLLGVIASITNALPAGDNGIGRVKVTDGASVQAVKAASTAPAAADPAAVIAISPNSPVGQVATSVTSVLQTTANTAQANQINIAAPGAGLFIYVDMIVITRVNNTAAAVAGDTTVRQITSAGLNGWAHECGSALIAGGAETFTYQFANGLKASAANTAVQISTPAGGAGTKFRITVTYRIGA